MKCPSICGNNENSFGCNGEPDAVRRPDYLGDRSQRIGDRDRRTDLERSEPNDLESLRVTAGPNGTRSIRTGVECGDVRENLSRRAPTAG